MFHSVFRKPSGNLFTYSFGQTSLEAEQAEGRSFDGNEAFGQYLYSRRIAQEPLRPDVLYKFGASQTIVTWKREDEEIRGAFDYAPIGGRHHDAAYLPLLCTALVKNLCVTREVLIWLVLPFARTFKIKDMFDKYLFKIVCDNGRVSLDGYQWLHSTPSVSIELEFK